jgi:hypothetical protein
MQYLFLTFAFARFAFADVIFTYSQLWQSNLAALINVFVFIWGALLTYTFSGAYLQLSGFRFRGIQRFFFVLISLLTAISALQPFLSSTQEKWVMAQELVINMFLIPFMGFQYLGMAGILIFARKNKTNPVERSAINWLIVHVSAFVMMTLVFFILRGSEKAGSAVFIELIGLFILSWNIGCCAFFVLRIREWIRNKGVFKEPYVHLGDEKGERKKNFQEQYPVSNKVVMPGQNQNQPEDPSLATAKEMLEDNENALSLFKIAELSGFSSKEALDRALRKAEGLTAVEYRMRSRKKP